MPAPAPQCAEEEGRPCSDLDLVRSVFDATGAPTAQVKAKVAAHAGYQGAIPKPAAARAKLPDGSPAAWDPVKGEWIGVTNKAKPRASRAPKAAAPKRKAPPPPRPFARARRARTSCPDDGRARRHPPRHRAARRPGDAEEGPKGGGIGLRCPEGALDEKKQAVASLPRGGHAPGGAGRRPRSSRSHRRRTPSNP